MSSIAIAWGISRLKRWRWPLFAPLVLPWSMLVIGDQPGTGVQLVFVWGSIDVPALHWFTLPEYLLNLTSPLPRRLLAWPVGSLLYLGALASTLSGSLFDREDPRVTAGLLVLSALNCLWFTQGMWRSNSAMLVALPIGTILLPTLAWWSYWPRLDIGRWRRAR